MKHPGLITCPHCGRENELHANVDNENAAPKPGCVALCWLCHKPAVFALLLGELVLRLPTPEEQVEIDADPTVGRAMLAIEISNTPSEAVRAARI